MGDRLQLESVTGMRGMRNTPQELTSGCKRSRNGRSVPLQPLERLALQGDQAAISRYVTCMTSNVDEMRRTDWDPRATLWLLDRGARSGSWSNATELFFFHLAGIGLRSSPNGLAAERFFRPSDCGFRCRKPDLVAAADLAQLLETLAIADESVLPPIYYESAETLTWIFVARQDDARALEWAKIAIDRAERGLRRNLASDVRHLNQLKTTMFRVARGIDADFAN